MIVQNDIVSSMTLRQSGINGTNYKKSSEKLTSGYRINRASDNAAGLSISESMRHMIRGLERGAQNAEEGISFIAAGDGAMSEIEAMLHRMKELTVQSLNDTNTQGDRIALEEEFEELQSEIDNICHNTQFNTEDIFDRHEPAYYQVKGNLKWDYKQMHEILAPDNELLIQSGTDEYRLTVPDGLYTTQELVDEIDTALMNLHPNPGFQWEFTKDGYCNLNLENGAKIDSVSGKLSYLLYGGMMAEHTEAFWEQPFSAVIIRLP